MRPQELLEPHPLFLAHDGEVHVVVQVQVLEVLGEAGDFIFEDESDVVVELFELVDVVLY